MRNQNFITIFAIVIILAAIVGGSYNSLVRSNENAGRAWGDVESTYQRRFDLIPNLVETVKGYATHEKAVFEAVTEARSKVGQMNIAADKLTPEALASFQQAQQGLSGALSRLIAVAEAYPVLKADGNFRDLQSQLEGTENRINVARERYNKAAQDFNQKKKGFPAVFTVGLFFSERPYFAAKEGADVAPRVNFNSER
jgi:LemA protein